MTHEIQRRLRGYRVKIGGIEIEIDFRTKTEAERWISNRLRWRETYGVGGQNERSNEIVKTG